MIPNNILPFEREYIQEENSRSVVISLTNIHISDLLSDSVKIKIYYKSSIYDLVGSPLQRGDLKKSTKNFMPVSDGNVAIASNSTLVRTDNGQIIGEFDLTGLGVRDIQTKTNIGTFDPLLKEFTPFGEGDPEDPDYVSPQPVPVEGEANYIIHLVRNGLITIDQLVDNMFDRIINLV